jgi:hypothetical protein
MSQIPHAGARCVMMQMDTTFSSFLQVNKIKYYRNIDQEIAPVRVRFLECSLLGHQLRPGKAMLHVPLKCWLLRFGPHCVSTEIYVCNNFKNIDISDKFGG